MKIILSRKGFDAATGGVPSPIFPDGTMRSLPIPETLSKGHTCRYGDVRLGSEPLAKVVQDLKGRWNGQPIDGHSLVHLDPDLDINSVARMPGWKPLFGQTGAAESHLQNQKVGKGDVFLFYGWFKEVERVGGTYRYVPNSPDRHVLFGWLQIEERYAVDGLDSFPDWMLGHPHCQGCQRHPRDSVYVSTSSLKLDLLFPGAEPMQRPGAGLFQPFRPELVLTAPGYTRSYWQLPEWFYPQNRRSTLSYHENPKRWSLQDGHTLLRTVGRGQEFVLDCEDYPEAIDWLRDLLMLVAPLESTAH
ncbi:Nmad3 family putative nucleotide modification protein [Egbenema bharatensis]|uniref:Nmad3 family putative nucleotide modification protein n=1 Tax=Egbenema bharatensis TaxID=3463334 RepID=UPI003A8B1C6F